MTEAKQQYRHWLAQSKRQPTDAIAWFNLGWWSAKVGLFAESVQAYEHALTLGIASPEEAMANIASVYSEWMGQTAPAGQWLDWALLENPNYYPAIFKRAHIAEQVGDRDTACQYFEQAAALAPAARVLTLTHHDQRHNAEDRPPAEQLKAPGQRGEVSQSPQVERGAEELAVGVDQRQEQQTERDHDHPVSRRHPLLARHPRVAEHLADPRFGAFDGVGGSR